MRGHLGEVEAAVQEGDAGGQDDVLRGHRAQAGPHRGPLLDGDVDDAYALDQDAVAAAELGGQGGEHVQRVELRLVGQPDRAVAGVGQLVGVDPLHLQADPLGDLELLAHRGGPGPLAGVGVRVAPLDRDVVVLAVAQRPGEGLPVALDVRLGHVLGVVLDDVRQHRALQQAELGRGVAGGDGADVAGLQHSDPAAGAGQQGRGDQPGQSGPDHDVVVRGVGEERVGRDGGAAVQPE